MRAVTTLPLLPAAMVTAALATTSLFAFPVALILAVALSMACAGLAAASADRMRRLAWTAAALAAIALAGRLLAPDVAPAVDLGAFGELRAALGQPLKRLVPEPESGILIGIALGDRGGVGPELAYAFARSGTSHLLAISGFNMTLVAAAIGTALRGRAGPRVRAAATVAAVIAYSLLVGFGASVVRSAVMAVITALGLALGRRAAAANGLCAAIAAMLVLDPAIIGDAGFLLSAGATAGLLAFQVPIASRLAWLPTLAREGLAATLAATLPTLPVIAGIFGRISLVSPLANIVAVPLFPPLMVVSVLTIVAGSASIDAARPFALVAYGLAFALRVIVETAAASPFASIDVPPGPVTAVVCAIGCCALVVVTRHLRPRIPLRLRSGWQVLARRARSRRAPTFMRRRAALLSAALLVVALAGGALIATSGPVLRVRALDIGQGDSFLVEADGKFALVDGGPDPQRLLAELGASLPPWTRRIDLVALTHAHLDHGAGLLAVLDRYDVGLAMAPRGLNPGPLADAWNERIARHGIARADVSAGSTVRLGRARVRVLAPNADPTVDVPSLVLRFEHGAFSMLFSGDATDAAQADLLLDPASLRARVYVPPHHGAATPYAAALATAVHPDVALISVGLDNRYGHPTAETLAALRGVPTYRTDHDGTIEVVLQGDRVEVHAHANGLAPPRPQGIPHVGR